MLGQPKLPKAKGQKHTTTIPILITKNQKLALHAAKEQREAALFYFICLFDWS
ncbi:MULTISPECIES: hypothetical protein [unclassified Bartonella]|uniref:hypothetical protein n=1 Tax=unclassified Bartonella TaxID=2645622 RepID=UPI00236100F3|nr:hypothetical protein [Bartonella sp. AU18XJBT]